MLLGVGGYALNREKGKTKKERWQKIKRINRQMWDPACQQFSNPMDEMEVMLQLQADVVEKEIQTVQWRWILCYDYCVQTESIMQIL